MKPDLPPPLFAPPVVADAILHAAQYPARDIFVGKPAIAGSSFAHLAPGITDMVLRRCVVELQQQNVPAQRTGNGNLFAPNKNASLRESSDRKRVTFQHSPYTEAMTHATTSLDPWAELWAASSRVERVMAKGKAQHGGRIKSTRYPEPPLAPP